MKNIKITKNTDNLSNQHNNNITPPPPPPHQQHNRHLGKNLVLLIGLLALPLFSQAQTIISTAVNGTQNFNTPNEIITVTKAGSITTDSNIGYGLSVASAASSAVVINNGRILTSRISSHGIVSIAVDVSITNNGTITTTGSAAHGIYSISANAIITHSGTITTTYAGSHGIWVSGANSEITVSGRISATGSSAFAVLGGTPSDTLNLEGDYDIANGEIDLGDGIDTVNINGIGAGTATQIVFHNVETVNLNDPRLTKTVNGDITTVMIDRSSIIINDAQITTQTLGSPNTFITVTKAGSIKTTTNFTYGINVVSAATNAIVINNGTISTDGLSANGILSSFAADVSITNNGIITTTGGVAYGIYSSGANTIITHSGTITTTGNTSQGIVATGADNEITVSGRISTTGTNSFAVLGGTYTNTLNLEGNYDIANGIIDLGFDSSQTNTVNIKGIGAGTATSIVFINVKNIDYNMNPRLNVIDNGNTKTLTIDRTSNTVLLNNNGCTLNANTDKKPFDPTLPLLALLAGGYLLNRKLKLN